MRVGLVRHFRVLHPLIWWRWVSVAELRQWFEHYDAAAVEPAAVDLRNVAWQRCLSSDLRRAQLTAEAIHRGPVQLTSLLREVALPTLSEARWLRLPFVVWALLTPLAWRLNRAAQHESRAQVQQRVAAVLDKALRPGEDVLLVGHGALMRFLAAELRRRGVRGPAISRRPANGELFVFER